MNENNNIKIDAKNWSELSYRDKVAYSVTIGAFVIGVALSITGMVLPPVGEIHPSVITLVGLFLSFAGALLGISHHFENELGKFKASVEQKLNEKGNRES